MRSWEAAKLTASKGFGSAMCEVQSSRRLQCSLLSYSRPVVLSLRCTLKFPEDLYVNIHDCHLSREPMRIIILQLYESSRWDSNTGRTESCHTRLIKRVSEVEERRYYLNEKERESEDIGSAMLSCRIKKLFGPLWSSMLLYLSISNKISNFTIYFTFY